MHLLQDKCSSLEYFKENSTVISYIVYKPRSEPLPMTIYLLNIGNIDALGTNFKARLSVCNMSKDFHHDLKLITNK